VTNANDDQIKIRIPLLGAALESGSTSELVWAEPLGGKRYRIWNIPALAYNVEMRDIVECDPDAAGGPPVAVRVVERGDCYVIRLVFNRHTTERQIDEVLGVLTGRGAVLEKFKDRCWGVGLRSIEDYRWVGGALQPFVDRGVLTFESAFQPDQPWLGGNGPPA
jgi:hypothetical protein